MGGTDAKTVRVLPEDAWDGALRIIARQVRREYMAEKIKAEEFLRRIDTTHELVRYDAVKQEFPLEKSVWQKRVSSDPDFDPVRSYPSSMMVLNLPTLRSGSFFLRRN